MCGLDDDLLEVVPATRGEHLEQGWRETQQGHREDREVATTTRTKDRDKQRNERSRCDNAEHECLHDRDCDQHRGRHIVRETDERSAQRNQGCGRCDAEHGGREDAGHDLSPAQRERGEPLRIESFVVAESENRKHCPSEGGDREHHDREIRRSCVVPGRR